MAAKLDKRLVLNEWLFSQLGFSDTENGMRQISRMLHDVQSGWDEQNIFFFRRRLELSLPDNRALTNDLLVEYDRNIYSHWQSITVKRRVKEHREILPLYFQYLALIFTEYYLDRWTRDKQQRSATLLDELNSFREIFNSRFTGRGAAADKVGEYTESDLSKLAFWIATGGGKTLIMHCNIRQLDHYLKNRKLERHFNKYILITPNEGLTDQHIEEFTLSGMRAERYERNRYGLYTKSLIEVVEITKLKEKTGVTTVAVDEFGKNNVVMVDEGHRGTGGDEWFKKRQHLCSEGFSFEYSATFGQSVNSLTGVKKTEMGQLYAKGVIFDYSYKFFFSDGYGKDFHILNFKEDGTGTKAEVYKLYLTACLLRFYQQCKLYKDNGTKYASYLVDDPLMVFVGGSVTGKREKERDTDIVKALRFFADFIADEKTSIHYLDLLLRGKDELHDDKGLVFRTAFNYVRNIFPVTKTDVATELYQDILQVVFNASGKGLLHSVYLKGSGNEIGLRVGDGGDYFGVINVGEPKKLWNMLQDGHGEIMICKEQQFAFSLFDNIKEPDSQVRLLIGAKKFTEGWSCWRVSCMGLINIGRKEGSQIIQLFGRGIRLKGLDFTLKRSGAIKDQGVVHPKYIEELETLNVFGIRADYMQAFNEYLDEEDVVSEKNVETISLPTIENLARTDLKVILPQKDMPDFKEQRNPSFGRDEKIRTKISADWHGRLESKTKRFSLHSQDEAVFYPTSLQPDNRKFLDYDALYIDLLAYKKKNAMYNLEISRSAVKSLLNQDDWYDLYIPEHLLEFTRFDRVNLWQEIASDLLKKYCRKFYDFKKDEFEGPFQEYRTIQEIIDSPEERYSRQFLQNLRIEYQAAIEKSREQLIEDLRKIGDKLVNKELQDYSADGLAVFQFAQHLYQPLIHVAQGTVGVSIKPTHLNRHEKQFVDDLKAWCIKEQSAFLEGKELYILRNQSKGKGISFFDEGNFYPDFVLWLIEGEKQYITFADPHGLQHARSFSDSKIQFYKRIKEIEKERSGLKDENVSLNSFILSPTRYSSISHWNGGVEKQVFNDHHVLFIYDDVDRYIDMMFEKLYQTV